jgi:hypothetical protein
MKKRKKKNKQKVPFVGVLIIVLIILVGIFFGVAVSMYNNLKMTQSSVFNLYNEVKTANKKIDKFSFTGEESAQKSKQFTEATKNWQIYQNEEFHFQFKHPVSWGELEFTTVVDSSRETDGKMYITSFNKTVHGKSLNMEIAEYDYFLDDEVVIVNRDIVNRLTESQAGVCHDDLFNKLESTGLGEVRNCYVYENILGQKFLVYLFLEPHMSFSQLFVVYPRDSYYIKMVLPESDNSELEYFIQSLVFLK